MRGYGCGVRKLDPRYTRARPYAQSDVLLTRVLTCTADDKKASQAVQKLASQSRKRERQHQQNQSRKAPRVNDPEGGEGGTGSREAEDSMDDEEEKRDLPKFLELPTPDDVKRCYKEFYDATSNAAMERGVCGVCAREIFKMDMALSKLKLSDIPRLQRLFLAETHPDHDLYNSMLLQPEGIITDGNGDRTVNVCAECAADLRSKKATPPRFSLANNMWIGPILWVIQILTLPEQMLLSHIFLRVTVVKLHGKSSTFQQDPTMLQTALRGTVSSYPLDLDAEVGMLEGGILPRKLIDLPKVLAVTFVRRGRVPKAKLLKILRIRRFAVLDALQFLINSGNRHFKDISIDWQALQDLPIDDIPVEILGTMWQNTDEGVLDEENSGYIPHRQDEGEKRCKPKLTIVTHVNCLRNRCGARNYKCRWKRNCRIASKRIWSEPTLAQGRARLHDN